MFPNKDFYFSLFLLSSTSFFAQKTAVYTAQDVDFKNATELFMNASYAGALDRYNELKMNPTKDADIREISDIYAAVCAVKLNQKGGITRYETLTKNLGKKEYVIETYPIIGDYYYSQQDYSKAFSYYSLGFKDQPVANFKYGYSAFNQKEYDRALDCFSRLEIDHPNYEDAQYLMGHIYYQTNKNEQAKQVFETLKSSEKYGVKSRSYLLQTAYKTEDYDLAIEEGKAILAQDTTGSEDLIEANKLTGESLFNQGKYLEAIPLLEKSMQGMDKPSATDYYRLGYAYYNTKQYTSAINQYNQIVHSNDEIVQVAYYQLGHSYLAVGQKNEALQAFYQAALLETSPAITEDAWYSYAKLSYEIGNTNGNTQEAIYQYIKKYPAKRTKEMHTLLSDSYNKLERYDQAYAYLKNTLVKQDSNLIGLQHAVGLRYGAQKFKEGDYQQAIIIFEEVLSDSQDEAIQTKGLYWKAQSQYLLSQYAASLETVKSITPGTSYEAKQSSYLLGYDYFKLNQYAQAAEAFTTYIKNPSNDTYLIDAKIRLADCLYASNSLDKAYTFYKDLSLVQNEKQDYAYFQMGMIKGLQQKNIEKAELLGIFRQKYPNSEYLDDSFYQTGDAYFKSGDADQAIQSFDQLLTNYPASDLVGITKFKKAQVYYNQKQLDKALVIFKDLATDSSQPRLGQESINSIKQISIEKDDLAGFESWMKKNNIAYDSNEISLLSFEKAEKSFDDKKYIEAIPLLEKFIITYPKSTLIDQGTYYLAESYYQNQQQPKALPLFKKIENNPSYQQKANVRLAQIYASQKQFIEAKKYLLLVKNSPINSDYNNYVTTGLMRIAVQEKNNTDARTYAEELLKDYKTPPDVKVEAQLIMARALVTENPAESQKLYTELSKTGGASIKAESLYYESVRLASSKKYAASNEIIFKLASTYPDEGDWTPKALLVMSDNYLALKDKFQAIGTLNTLIESYPDFPEYVTKAKAKKAMIK